MVVYSIMDVSNCHKQLWEGCCKTSSTFILYIIICVPVLDLNKQYNHKCQQLKLWP